ncbi:uncharacterized protein BP01DRAFT_354565 [Aspergillus saccharolyticus JOP 1030-1]|uniref:C2H2-type domain-containing protein n=1 Tax=Aspergillus saccharolyticus JOP 1030-1 TaxID=1450539 RepID=A0A318ZII7_9EURO|nr:hypothetical protein BP01DRAFT_354565 [Aspergillus saccharolyticus JOP 1030-1]PYH47376.1 hypothetical protein BP01DRAFT_354565 [Aspergillus saccharolyticus JOP 1030-1]
MTTQQNSPETITPLTTWSCTSCEAVFHRIDHYKRHIASHSTDKPYQCSFCHARYKRGDVLRRHWKSCPARQRTGHAIPEPRTGGKERHACDTCARLKKSCDGGRPCLECGIKGRGCTYRRVDEIGEGVFAQGESNSQESQVGDPEVLPWSLGPQNFYSLQAARASYGV